MFDIQIIDALVNAVQLAMQVLSVSGALLEAAGQATTPLVEAMNAATGAYLEPASVSGAALETLTGALSEIGSGPVTETLSVVNPSVQ